MRITELRISNFKAITNVELKSLADVVVIAGPNGCGKSCIFDAIRLLKSAYGGYQPNEWHNWFGEFQINVNQTSDQWAGLLQRKHLPMRISAVFELSEAEIQYLRNNTREVLTDQIWREQVPEYAGWRSTSSIGLAGNIRAHEPAVMQRLEKELPAFVAELETRLFEAELVVQLGKPVTLATSRVLEVIFTTYKPGTLGIIDYHGANRTFGREQVGGINLNIEGESDRLRQHALYNSTAKYNNLKSEMASVYVRGLLSRDAGASALGNDLIETLQELFTTFFPGKQFLGPQPSTDGRLSFPVRTPSGVTHDIDDLSSGEKEVVYGYLRLRNAAPINSILLIDEPELHLNPRLIRGLASFYQRHIGKALDNQLWLVTHSDTLIRDAVGQAGFSVYHMQAPGALIENQQATPIEVARDFDRVVIDIVGDLAAYRPGAKVVIFEGGGDTEFDVRMSCLLFPELQERVNPLSGGSKRRVTQLYELLEAARQTGAVQDRFYAVTDRDTDDDVVNASTATFAWDRYHIENYLLEPKFILTVLTDLNRLPIGMNTQEPLDVELASCASAVIPYVVSHELRRFANQKMVSQIDLGFDPKRNDIGAALSEAVNRSANRVTGEAESTLTRAQLIELENKARERALASIENGNWRIDFPGRRCLTEFVRRHAEGVGYEPFRDLILARMRDAGYQPLGMKGVIDTILNA